MDQYHPSAVNLPGNAPIMPPLQRTSMPAKAWQGFFSSLIRACFVSSHKASQNETRAPWEKAAQRRRRTLLSLTALCTLIATGVLSSAQPDYQYPYLQWLQIGLFALLFAWVSAGCMTAVMGFIVVMLGDTHALSKHRAGKQPLDAGARTAIIMPICNENVSTVFAGLRASYESLLATGEGAHFDVFILSDSSDAAIRMAEREACLSLRVDLANHRIYYRCRKQRTRRKSGNVADFCRRWGSHYRYMITLDADSIMSGSSLLTLVRLMEAHPDAGILQTSPQVCGHATLHARAQQFASRLSGRLFTAGMQYWQLGEAHYWGHNAIIRLAPFMQHCGLARLPGDGALSGEILSHDFIEAALMRRAGYHVWLVPDLGGSYEQQPPNLLAELQRDRRWCQGNLQNARLIAEPGLHPVHRGMLATGAMAYLSAPLWLLYIVLGVLLWLLGGNVFFTPEGYLTLGVLGLWACTLIMLTLPRVLGIVAVILKNEQHFYGGYAALLKSALLEAGLSALQAPLRMVAHSLFVLGALTGWKLEWKSPPRQALDVNWHEARQHFAWVGGLILGVSALLARFQLSALFWFIPVGIPLLLAVPLIVWTSRTSLGERMRAWNLLLIKEELWPPIELHRAWGYTRLYNLTEEKKPPQQAFCKTP